MYLWHHAKTQVIGDDEKPANTGASHLLLSLIHTILIYSIYKSLVDDCIVWLTVPAAWNTQARGIMHKAAVDAGLVRSATRGNWNHQERMQIISYVKL